MDAARPGAASRLATVPTLAEVSADPTIIDGLPLDVLVDVLRQVRYLKANIEAALSRRMLRTNGQDPGEVLDVETAAERLHTSMDSLYRKHKRLRLGYIDPLDGRLKFTKQELVEYVQRQRRR